MPPNKFIYTFNHRIFGNRNPRIISNISSFYFSRFSEYLSNLVALAQTIINEIGKLESTNVSQSYNKSDINTQEDDIEYYKDMYYDYSKILANLRTELIQIVQNL